MAWAKVGECVEFFAEAEDALFWSDFASSPV